MKLDIQNEMDIMLAHRRAMQFAKFSGFGIAEQTRFATAVSEICRNAVEHANAGEIAFSIAQLGSETALTALITDKGKGIKDLSEVLNRNPATHKGRGLGLIYARRLTDSFKVDTTHSGTSVRLGQYIIPKGQPLNKLVVQGWVQHIRQEPTISAYEELKIKNLQLMEMTEELQANSRIVAKQLSEIQTLNSRLAANNQRMKEFTYAISHDLKNPLSSLILATNQLTKQSDDENKPVYLGVLSRSVQRLDKIIHGLVDILDIEHKDKIQRQAITFDQVFAETRDIFSETIQSAGASITTDFEVGQINYVEGYLQSIFQNMISNSLKYRYPERPLHVDIRSKQEGDKLILSFTDNGTGMDMQQVGNKIFQPFNRFSETVEGRGIGLYLIKGMVENNGGDVSVSSELGIGTTFNFTLIPY